MPRASNRREPRHARTAHMRALRASSAGDGLQSVRNRWIGRLPSEALLTNSRAQDPLDGALIPETHPNVVILLQKTVCSTAKRKKRALVRAASSVLQDVARSGLLTLWPRPAPLSPLDLIRRLERSKSWAPAQGRVDPRYSLLHTAEIRITGRMRTGLWNVS